MPKQKINGNFMSLQESHPLWEALETQPFWWSNILNDPELYVEVRKDNYINVYYYGGCVALIYWTKDGLMAKTNRKYANDNFGAKALSNTSCYCNCQALFQSPENLDAIKRRIAEVYHKQPMQAETDSLKGVHISSEKMVQGKLILHSPYKFIDSELAYQTQGRKTMRIDLIELRNQMLVFVELKLITDSRLRHINDTPEIMEQMKKYHNFIHQDNHLEALKRYYHKILQIKRRIGIWEGKNTIESISTRPELLIIDTYSRMTKDRQTRIANIRKSLETGGSFFNFSIQKYQDLCK